MSWWKPTERERWAAPRAVAHTQPFLGLPEIDGRARDLYETGLPRGLRVPRFVPDRPPVNFWMPPHEPLRHTFLPGQIILGKIAGLFPWSSR